MKKADIGLIGLAVMGENLVMNMESKGFTVAVFNRTTSKVDDFIAEGLRERTSSDATAWKSLQQTLRNPARSFSWSKQVMPSTA